ncbi:MAG: hypothetical protein HY740_09980 [Chloroflexi bacterium]|nr:hypothetical protein [Chloroflexota bacterium]
MKKIIYVLALIALMLSACSTPAPLPTSAPTLPPAQPTSVPPTQAPQPTAAPAQAQPAATQAAATTVPTLAPTLAPTRPPALPTAAQPQVASMVFEDFRITPNKITISVGTTVVFQIRGSKHQPYSSFPNNTNLSGLFESPPNLGAGTSYQFTFRQAGVITVRCGYHTEMVATIEVTP